LLDEESRQALARTLGWMNLGTEHLETLIEGLPGETLSRSSSLPGWTGKHIVTHLARNADALVNLLTWAQTGIETPMYATPEQRAADIAEGAKRSTAVVRADFLSANRRLDHSVGTMSDGAWCATVRTVRGRSLPAVDVVWLRCREVWIHAADLHHDALLVAPDELVDALLQDVIDHFSGSSEPPSLNLRLLDRNVSRYVGGARDHSISVAGSTRDILMWLTGRSFDGVLADDNQPLPSLPAWL
jgi:maleylpyruvate isomerase